MNKRSAAGLALLGLTAGLALFYAGVASAQEGWPQQMGRLTAGWDPQEVQALSQGLGKLSEWWAEETGLSASGFWEDEDARSAVLHALETALSAGLDVDDALDVAEEALEALVDGSTWEEVLQVIREEVEVLAPEAEDEAAEDEEAREAEDDPVGGEAEDD